MDINLAIRHLLNGECVLFLGSGFSVGATNANKQAFSTATPLAHKLLIEAGYANEDLIDDLGSASEIYQDVMGEHKLVEFLRNEYTAIEITKSQEFIGSLRFLRIYTTNYDNVIDLAYQKNRKALKQAVLSNRLNDFRDKNNLCVYLNGRIQNLTIESLNNTFKLTNVSYLTDDITNSPWITLFRTDLKAAKAIFFIGYSMQYDLDLQRIVYEDSQLKEKCFFILRDNEPKATISLIKKFGTPCPISLDGFIEKVQQLAADNAPTAIKLPPPQICFTKIKLPNAPSPILDGDVFSLLTKGEYIFDNIYHSILSPNDYKYCIYRTRVNEIYDAIINNGKKNILIHSDLGNGKTILIQELEAKLAYNGYNIYHFNKFWATLNDEIETICQQHDKTVFVFEDYSDKIKYLEALNCHRTDQILIVSERSSMNDLYYEKLLNIFTDFEHYDINKLNDEEVSKISDILTTYGLWAELSSKRDDLKGRFVIEDCNRHISSLILKLLHSPNILNRFQKLITSLKKEEGYYDAIIIILIAKVSRIEIDLDDLSYAIGAQHLNTPKFKKSPQICEFVNFDNNTIKPKSAIVAMELLQRIVDSRIIVSVLINTFKRLAPHYHSNLNIKNMLQKIMTYTNLQHVLNKEDQNYKYNLLSFYESIKVLHFCEKNPHFWLQYAIVMLSQHEYEKAKAYFDASYSYAKKIENFDTFQIDNHYARFLLENEIEAGTKSTCIDAFTRAHNILMDPKHKKEVRHYPYRVAQNYYPFYERFYKSMSIKEQQIFIKACVEMLERIQWYEKTCQTQDNKIDVQKAKQKLTVIVAENMARYDSKV